MPFFVVVIQTSIQIYFLFLIKDIFLSVLLNYLTSNSLTPQELDSLTQQSPNLWNIKHKFYKWVNEILGRKAYSVFFHYLFSEVCNLALWDAALSDHWFKVECCL